MTEIWAQAALWLVAGDARRTRRQFVRFTSKNTNC